MEAATAALWSAVGAALEKLTPLHEHLAPTWIAAHEAMTPLLRRAVPLMSPFMERLAPVLSTLKSEPLLYYNPLGASGHDDGAASEAASRLSPALLELDTMTLGLMLLTICHATLHHRFLWTLLYLLVAIAVEQFFIRVGGTHCHAEALLMISQCSSANSVALYVPSLYVCVLAAERLQLHAIARPFATGALLSLYTLPYLSLGVSQQWWQYAPAFEANSSSAEAAPATAAALPLTGGKMWTLVGGVRSTALKPYSATASSLIEFR